MRDKHDMTTSSTSPKPKKKKNVTIIDVELMEVDETDKSESYNTDAMEIDEPVEILLARSNRWDEKIKNKKKKEEDIEKRRIESIVDAEKRKKLKNEKERKKAMKVKKMEMKIKKRIEEGKRLKFNLIHL